MDRPIPEITDQQAAAERSEAGGSDCQPPRRIQVSLGDEPGLEHAICIEDVDETVPRTSHVIVLGAILPGIRHVQIAPDQRNIERRESAREIRIGESSRHGQGRERGIENIDGVRVEVGRVDISVGEREALVYGAGGGAVYVDRGVRPTGPSRDCPVFRREEKMRSVEAGTALKTSPSVRPNPCFPARRHRRRSGCR